MGDGTAFQTPLHKGSAVAVAFSSYDPLPVFRRGFFRRGEKEAKIYVQSPGFAKYYINGQKITKGGKNEAFVFG